MLLEVKIEGGFGAKVGEQRSKTINYGPCDHLTSVFRLRTSIGTNELSEAIADDNIVQIWTNQLKPCQRHPLGKQLIN